MRLLNSSFCLFYRIECGEPLIGLLRKKGGRNHNKHHLIGGTMEKGENPFSCVLREIKEEAKHSPRKEKRLKYLCSVIREGRNRQCFWFFKIRLRNGEKLKNLVKKDYDLVWCKPEELLDKKYYAHTEYAIYRFFLPELFKRLIII